MKDIEKIFTSSKIEVVIGNPNTIDNIKKEYGNISKLFTEWNDETFKLKDNEIIIKYKLDYE